MSTQIESKKKAGNHITTKKTATKKDRAAISLPVNQGELKNIAVSEIDFSPLNYRKYFSVTALENFAEELKLHGIINPLTLRSMPSGRYELVAGERRLRASLLAGFKEVPAYIKVLTDAEVTEIQLSENLQRENPHPMDEAQGIRLMKEAHKSIDEIAARLVKSKQFVYSRIRLLALIEPIQEMFYADTVTLNQAFEIAGLSAQSQEAFFERHCAHWKEDEDFSMGNIQYVLSKFKCNLKAAPFNINDKKLVPDMGACTHCPFNSATLKSLFPEMAEQAVCTKKECYEAKCDAQFVRMFNLAFQEQQPQALIYHWSLTPSLQRLLEMVNGIADIPTYAKNEVRIITMPIEPDRNDFTFDPTDLEDEEFEDEDHQAESTDDQQAFDESAYNAALYEYHADMDEYDQLVSTGSLSRGLIVSETQVEKVLFSTDVVINDNRNTNTVTAKEVQEAIKAGEATPELLTAEIARLNDKEKRAKELDCEKIHLQIHTVFVEESKDISKITGLTDADLVAAKMLVYQSLDWSSQREVDRILFNERDNDLSFYETLQNLTEPQYAYLIRMAIGHRSEAKFPNNHTGQLLRKVAEDAGVNIATIEKEQQAKADTRNERLTERLTELDKKIVLLTHVPS